MTLPTTAPAMPVITVATFNYENGGRGQDNIVRLDPALDHIAESVPDLDLLFLQEATGYQDDGKRLLYQFAEGLHDRLTDTWEAYASLNNAIFFRSDVGRVAQHWHDDRQEFGLIQHTRPLRVRRDGLPLPMALSSVHWRYCSGTARLEQAEGLGNLIPLPAIVGGDFNGMWPGARELTPNWRNLDPHVRYHKTIFEHGTWVSDLRAGWMSLRQGWVDFGALAEDYTATTNSGSDKAPCRIDRLMVSPSLGAGIVRDSYRVHIPKRPVSDHRIVSGRVDLAEYGKPFHAPWWDEESGVGDTYVGGDDSGQPNRYKGWARPEVRA